MAYAFVNDAIASQAGALKTLPSNGINVLGGNLLLIAVRYSNAAAQTVTVTDITADNSSITADGSILVTGSVNNYIPLLSYYNATFGNGGAFFYALNSAATGNTAWSASFQQNCTNTGIYVAQYSGLSNLITSNGFENENPGTGPNAYTSATVAVGAVPAMAWGFLSPVHNFNLTPSAGNLFTGRSPAWTFGGVTNFALGEDARITSASNVAATWTVAENSGRYGFIAVFQELNQISISSSGIFVTP